MPDNVTQKDDAASKRPKGWEAETLKERAEAFTADGVSADDPHKAEKLAKAGRRDAPEEASE